MTSQTLAAVRGPIDHTHGTGVLPVPGSAAREAARLKATGEAHVWWWPLEDRVDQADFDLLDEVEQVRARRFRHEKDAAAFAGPGPEPAAPSADCWAWTPVRWPSAAASAPAAATWSTARRPWPVRPSGSR